MGLFENILVMQFEMQYRGKARSSSRGSLWLTCLAARKTPHNELHLLHSSGVETNPSLIAELA